MESALDLRNPRILEGLEGIECNIDEVLIYGATHNEHDRRLKTVLRRLTAAHVTLNSDKCIFSVIKIVFLGHVISANGIEADPEKIAAITNLSPPTKGTGSLIVPRNGEPAE